MATMTDEEEEALIISASTSLKGATSEASSPNSSPASVRPQRRRVRSQLLCNFYTDFHNGDRRRTPAFVSGDGPPRAKRARPIAGASAAATHAPPPNALDTFPGEMFARAGSAFGPKRIAGLAEAGARSLEATAARCARAVPRLREWFFEDAARADAEAEAFGRIARLLGAAARDVKHFADWAVLADAADALHGTWDSDGTLARLGARSEAALGRRAPRSSSAPAGLDAPGCVGRCAVREIASGPMAGQYEVYATGNIARGESLPYPGVLVPNENVAAPRGIPPRCFGVPPWNSSRISLRRRIELV